VTFFRFGALNSPSGFWPVAEAFLLTLPPNASRFLSVLRSRPGQCPAETHRAHSDRWDGV